MSVKAQLTGTVVSDKMEKTVVVAVERQVGRQLLQRERLEELGPVRVARAVHQDLRPAVRRDERARRVSHRAARGPERIARKEDLDDGHGPAILRQRRRRRQGGLAPSRRR